MLKVTEGLWQVSIARSCVLVVAAVRAAARARFLAWGGRWPKRSNKNSLL